MSDIKALLDKVASSPDPVVRGMALRFKEIEHEQVQIGQFFEAYEGARSFLGPDGIQEQVGGAESKNVIVGLPPLAGASSANLYIGPVTKDKPARRNTARALSSITVAIKDVIVKHGSPMKLGVLHKAYVEQTGEEVMISTFRQRLVKARTHIALLSAGYWPVDMVVNGGDKNAD